MADEPVTLEFISRQLARIQDRLGTTEDQITVLTGIAMRIEGSMEGLATEVRGMSASELSRSLRYRAF
jgi:hypothetical protein